MRRSSCGFRAPFQSLGWCYGVVKLSLVLFLWNLMGLISWLFNTGFSGVYNRVVAQISGLIRSSDYVAEALDETIKKELRKMKRPSKTTRYFSLPEKSSSREQVIRQIEGTLFSVSFLIEKAAEDGRHWKTNQLSGAVYQGDDEHISFLNETCGRYTLSNPLHSDIYPELRYMEIDIINIVASLYKGDCDTVCGIVSSGGTESIYLAVKAHRDYYNSLGIQNPEIIIPETAHVAFDKACHNMRVTLHKVPCDPNTQLVDLHKLESLINGNTILIVGSAYNFPTGVVDPLEEMSELAVKYGVGFHIDCCLGGFIIPFAKRLGYTLPNFEFSSQGVTSISCDPHKYGYGPKGLSVVLFRTPKLRSFAYYSNTKWTGGFYATHALAGSHDGSVIAGTWAVMIRNGMEGYLEATKSILEGADLLRKGIQKIEDLEIIGDSRFSVVSFTSKKFNPFVIYDQLMKKNWFLCPIQNPSGVHIAVTLDIIQMIPQLLKDIQEVLDHLEAHPSESIKGGLAPIYGASSFLPAEEADRWLLAYLDVELE